MVSVPRWRADMARGITARVQRGADATWQSRGWPTRGARGAQGAAMWQGATRPRWSMWAPVWGATWKRVGRWRAHGIVGPGNKFGAVTQMRYRTPIFNRIISKYFFRVGLCSHTIHFCSYVAAGQSSDVVGTMMIAWT